MKNLLMILLIGLCLGCSKSNDPILETKEIHQFINWLFAEENLVNDSLVFIQAKVSTTWRNEYLNEVYSIHDLKEHSGLSKQPISSFLRQEDLDKVFSESKIDFRFTKDLLSRHIKLLDNEVIEKVRLDPIDFQKNGGIEFSGKYQSFQILSKPIFFQDYRYCFIFIETVSWDLSSGGSGIGFYEKKKGKWEKIGVIPLVMSG